MATDKHSDQRKLPTVVDLTLDSDFESDDDSIGPTLESTQTAPPIKSEGKAGRPRIYKELKSQQNRKSYLAKKLKKTGDYSWVFYEPQLSTGVAHSEQATPSPRLSEQAIPARGSSVSLPGSAPTPEHTPPAHTHNYRTSNANTSSSVPNRPATATPTASMERRASINGDNQRQTAMIPAVNGTKDAERSAKRRKLSVTNGKPIAQDSVRVPVPKPANAQQLSKHGAAAPQPARASPAVAAPTSLRAKLNNMNGVPSVSFMNSALKPSASSIPVIDAMPPQAARPLFIGRMSHANTATGLLSPGLTSPESASVIVIDSDSPEPDEVGVTYLPPPTASELRKQEGTRPSSSRDAVKPAPDFPMTTPSTAVRVQPPLRQSSPIEPVSGISNVEPIDRDDMVGDLPVRQSTPLQSQQSPALSIPNALASSPASTPAKRGRPTQSGRATERTDPDHLLIFLKEVKKLKWAEITKEYLKVYPGSNYGRIQTHYSSVLNKRDRTQDPPTLNLPPRFAAESTIDWASVHANTKPPRVRKEVADLGNIGSPRSPYVEKSQAVPRAMQQIRDDRDSSSGDSLQQRQRSRRAVPINHTWPQLHTVKGGFKELLDNRDLTPGSRMNFEAHSRSESPSDETLVTSSRTGTSRSKPLDPDFRHQDATLGLKLQRNLRSVQQERMPYLSSPQRLAMHESIEEWTWDQSSITNWQGAILHVDFSPAELQAVKNVVTKVVPSGRQIHRSTHRRHLRAILKDLAEPKLQNLAHEISRHLRSRDIRSIRCFLEDAAAGRLSYAPQVQRLASAKPQPNMTSMQILSISSYARQRELGLQSIRSRQTASTPITYQLKNQLIDTLGPKSTWTGASSDIHTVAWSPDGQYFAAGAVAVTDSDSMQYNRPNVLMYGDAINSNIHELGKHCIDRKKTDAGANSTHAMHESQDPKLFTTVSSVAFSPSGRFMYSAGYDHSVCIWDVSSGSRQPYMVRELQHKAPVDVLAVNPRFDGVIATATKRTTDKSIKLVKFSEETVYDEPWQHTKSNFASTKAISRPDLKMSANALKFDPNGQLLLAGFGANMREDNSLDTSGDICLWDVASETALHVHGSSRNVFDVTFNPRPRHRSLFAVGCVANGNVNRGTRSVVRFYSPKELKAEESYKFTCSLELECKALDMNDVIWW
jgi:WD40 repeat protein